MRIWQVVALSVVISSTTLAVEWKKHPHLAKAAEQIQHAKQQLLEANDLKKTEFGGHRARAVELLNQAEREIQAAAAYAESAAP